MSFEERLADAVRDAVHRTYGVELDGIHVERPNDPAHGDFATNVALANAKVLRRNPREVAQNLVEALEAPFVLEAEGSSETVALAVPASSTSGSLPKRSGMR